MLRVRVLCKFQELEGRGLIACRICYENHGNSSDVEVENHGNVHLLKCVLLRWIASFKEYQGISIIKHLYIQVPSH